MLNKKITRIIWNFIVIFKKFKKKLKKTLKSVFKKSEKKEKKREEKNVWFAREGYRKITHLCWEEKSKREFNSFEVEKNSLFF